MTTHTHSKPEETTEPSFSADKGRGVLFGLGRIKVDGQWRQFRVPSTVDRNNKGACLAWFYKAGQEELIRKYSAKKAQETIGPTKLEAVKAIVPGMKFSAYAEEWTSGRLSKRHPDHVREKNSTRDEGVLRLYINPSIGDKPINAITLEDVEQLMHDLPKKLGTSSRKLIAQCVAKVFRYAIYPSKLIAASPIPAGFIPKSKSNKAKSYLYPKEDAKLIACEKVELRRRLAYGILAREGMRSSEMQGLRWSDVDLEVGTITLDENKTDKPRAWAMGDDVRKVLEWWKKETNGQEGDHIIGLDLANAVKWLRGDPFKAEGGHAYTGDLRVAGITRPQLFERGPNRIPFREHDLRGTFVTLSLACGKTTDWVSSRTGHTLQMVEHYKVAARTANDLHLGWLQPMDQLLPEMQAKKPSKK